MNSKLVFNPADLKVLVSDEHDLIRKSVRRELQVLGVKHISEANNSRGLQKLLQADNFSLCIISLRYSDEDGFEFLKLIRNKEIRSDIPIIVITGDTDRDDIVKAIDTGANDYILKPFKAKDLENKIISVLNGYHSPSATQKAIRKAENFIDNKEYEDAQRVLDALLDNGTNNPAISHLQSVILYKQKKFDASISRLERNISEYPEYLKNYKTLSNLLLALKRKDAAIAALTKELTVNPKQMKRQIKLGSLFLNNCDYNNAIEHYRIALLENNKNPDGLFGMGVAYAKLGNLEKSTYYFKRLRRQTPDKSGSLEAIVKYCREDGSIKTAELALRDEKKTHPERLDTYNILAQLYFEIGEEEKGIKTLEEATIKNPLATDAYKSLAKYHTEQKGVKSAAKVFETMIEKSKDSQGYILLAELYSSNKDLSSALSTIYSGIKEQNNLDELYKILSATILKTHQLGKAYFVQKKSFQHGECDPTFEKNHVELKKQIQSRRSKNKPQKKKSAS